MKGEQLVGAVAFLNDFVTKYRRLDKSPPPIQVSPIDATNESALERGVHHPFPTEYHHPMFVIYRSILTLYSTYEGINDNIKWR